jgi:hypothetical protein
MTDLTPRLARLGDALERATERDLRPKRRRSRRVAIAVVTALIAVPGAAVAGIELISEDDVAASLPAGTLSLAGTEPDCTVVRQDVEYHCVLARAPAPEVPDWKGAVEPTVDASKHVNGGCRSLKSEGTEWRCYIGEEAVRQQIIGPGFLGEYAPSPGVG